MPWRYRHPNWYTLIGLAIVIGLTLVLVMVLDSCGVEDRWEREQHLKDRITTLERNQR